MRELSTHTFVCTCHIIDTTAATIIFTINLMITIMKKRTYLPIAEETYLYGKVQDPGLNMGGGRELRKEEMPKVHVML